MKVFNHRTFLCTIGNIARSMGTISNDLGGKVVIAETIKRNGFSLKDTFSYINSLLENNRLNYEKTKLSENDWKKVTMYFIEKGGAFGDSLNEAILSKTRKTSWTDLFFNTANECGLDIEDLTLESTIDILGWRALVMSLIGISELENTETVSAHTRRGRAVVMRNESGEIVGTYSTICAAAKETGLNRSSINKCVLGTRGYSVLKLKGDEHSYTFEYAEGTPMKSSVISTKEKTTRRYTKKTIVLINKSNGDVLGTYPSAIKLSQDWGINKDDVYYRLKAKNHTLFDDMECWYEDEYDSHLATMKACA